MPIKVKNVDIRVLGDIVIRTVRHMGDTDMVVSIGSLKNDGLLSVRGLYEEQDRCIGKMPENFSARIDGDTFHTHDLRRGFSECELTEEAVGKNIQDLFGLCMATHLDQHPSKFEGKNIDEIMQTLLDDIDQIIEVTPEGASMIRNLAEGRTCNV